MISVVYSLLISDEVELEDLVFDSVDFWPQIVNYFVYIVIYAFVASKLLNSRLHKPLQRLRHELNFLLKLLMLKSSLLV